MIPITNFLKYPEGNPNPDIILVCSISPERRVLLQEIILSAGYGICGPFESHLDIFEILGRTEISAIIFDTRDNYSNSFKFLNMMTRYPDIPLLLIGPIDHTINSKLDKIGNRMAELDFPIKSGDVIRKIDMVIEGKSTETSEITFFMNEVFKNIIKISPRDRRAEIRKILVYHVEQLAQGSDTFEINSENAIFITTTKKTDDSQIIKTCQRILRDLIENLNYKLNAEEEWGKSLVHDAIYQSYYLLKGTPGPVRELLETLDLDDIDFYNRISGFVSGINDSLICTIGHLVLEDTGPVVDRVLNLDNVKNVFNQMSASQIISLMGQGENYHEGLYGPIPSSVDPNVMILIFSRVLNDDTINDLRLQGKTLSVIALAFSKGKMNLLPPRTVLRNVFAPFQKIEMRQQVDNELLKQIRENFIHIYDGKH